MSFLTSGGEQTYFMSHKSGYLQKLKSSAKSYNSMNIGMAAIVSLESHLEEAAFYLVINSREDQVLGVTASAVSLAGIEQKHFIDEVTVE